MQNLLEKNIRYLPSMFLLLFWWLKHVRNQPKLCPVPNNSGHRLAPARVTSGYVHTVFAAAGSWKHLSAQTTRGTFGKRFPSLPDLSQKGELAQTERIIRLAKATDISLGPNNCQAGASGQERRGPLGCR